MLLLLTPQELSNVPLDVLMNVDLVASVEQSWSFVATVHKDRTGQYDAGKKVSVAELLKYNHQINGPK